MSETTQPETTQEETTAGKPLSRAEQARAALSGRRNKTRQVPLTQPAQSIPVSYLGDAATTQPSTGAALQSSSPALSQQSSEAEMQSSPTTIVQGYKAAPSLQSENASEQPHTITAAKESDLAPLQQPVASAVPGSATAAPLQVNTLSPLQNSSTVLQQPIASTTPESNTVASSQLGATSPQQERNTLSHPAATTVSLHGDAVVMRESDNVLKQQQNIASPLQPNTVVMQSSNTPPPQQVVSAAPPYSVPTSAQSSSMAVQQENISETEQEGSTTSSSISPIVASEHRDNAVSRYRDETTVTHPPVAGVTGSSNALTYQSESAPTLQQPSTIPQQRGKEVSQPGNTTRVQQEGTALVQQENIVASPGRDAVVEQEDDPAAAIKSMFAAVPEGAIAELMQALLVQPRVNDENKSQWRSGGMQVTYGTHKKYKLLADQYGVHMRDIVEQTLKACLPFWRAQLKHLREIGALSEEEAEDELE